MTTEAGPTSAPPPEDTPTEQLGVVAVTTQSGSSEPTHPGGAADSLAQSKLILRGRWRIRRLAKVVLRFLLRASLRVLFYLSPIIFLGMYIGWRELKTSRWQAHYLSRIANESTFTVEDGASSSIRFPDHGPYDQRLGYSRIPVIVEHLKKAGYAITKQARWSEWLLWLAEKGINPTYREKTRAGITILDRKSTTIYATYRPERIYETFEEIPRLILDPLLFIENREILDPNSPNRNPAVEWDRLGKAVLEKVAQLFKPEINAPGGSTIATQLEKYRHSKEGRTGSIKDKLKQMSSASLRAYMYGEETTQTRKQIILQYINSIPLAALPGFGEVNGLGDGLWAWYGEDFNAMNLALRQADAAPHDADPAQFAQPFKEALSLFIAHRRPSYYLLSGVSELNALTNSHLDLLSREGVISPALAAKAKAVDLTLRRAAPKPPRISFLQRKAANAIRTRLLQLTDYRKLYDLDQLDLSVRSTMDNEANEAVTEILQRLKDPEKIKKLGLTGHRTLDQGDPSKVIYSVTLYERRGNANLLRVQTDNFDKPFSINEGTRLDLGSTAKLRTLVTYLDLIGHLFDKYHGDTATSLKSELS
jgi:membrane peptidoglycan carboxypeptidase